MNEHQAGAIRFQLQVPGEAGVDVQLRRTGRRWVATVLIGSRQIVAIGISARDSLRVALEPLGRSRAMALMADVGLLAPSIELIQLDPATVA